MNSQLCIYTLGVKKQVVLLFFSLMTTYISSKFPCIWLTWSFDIPAALLSKFSVINFHHVMYFLVCFPDLVLIPHFCLLLSSFCDQQHVWILCIDLPVSAFTSLVIWQREDFIIMVLMFMFIISTVSSIEGCVNADVSSTCCLLTWWYCDKFYVI